MKYLMTAALALSLMAGAGASAQDRHDEHRGDRGGDRGGHPGGGNGGGPHGPPSGAMHGPAPGGAQHSPPAGAMRGPAPGAHMDRGPAPGGARPDARFGGGPGRPGPGYAGGAPSYHARPGGFLAGHGWRFNQRFRGPEYRYPRGYGYQYWAFGAFLPGVFLTQDYTLYNYWTYGLPAPPPGYHWIRVGPDALLVRYGDGYVLDVAYGLFY